MKKLLGIFAVSALTILGCTTAFASNSVQGDADSDGILTAKDSAYVLQKTLDSTFKVPMADEEYSVYCDVNGDKVVNADDASLILQKVLNDSVKFAPIGGSTETTTETTTATTTETTTVTTTETTTQVTTEGTTEETTIPEGFNTVPENFDYTVNVSNFSELKSALSDCAKKSGQKAIYITDDINATEQIKLATSNANISLIGVEKADGSYPAIDFAKFRDSKNSTGENGTGIYVSKGSYYNFKNLIVKNAPDCGMRIKNSNSGNCIVQNCVFKYNNNSGISVTAGGHDNTFIGVDSYRNCDLVQKLGSDADGFSVKLNAGKNNKFFACRAWENGDDGWDSYNYSGDSPYHLDYIECLCYHNGDYDIYNGKWDYENNKLVTILDPKGTLSNNWKKGTPCIQADILGDWREEAVWRNEDDTELRIYTTTDLTDHKFYTFMHDSVYRLSVAFQNTAYNQCTQTGFYIGPEMDKPPVPNNEYVRGINIPDFTEDIDEI